MLILFKKKDSFEEEDTKKTQLVPNFFIQETRPPVYSISGQIELFICLVLVVVLLAFIRGLGTKSFKSYVFHYVVAAVNCLFKVC